MRFAIGEWGLSVPNKNMLIKTSIFFYALNIIAFFGGADQGVVHRFFRSLCVSFVITLCFYLYLLMGVFV